MKLKHLFVLFCLASIVSESCAPDHSPDFSPISMEWSLDSIQIAPSSHSYINMTLINRGEKALANGDWKIGYSHITGPLDPTSIPADIRIDNKKGDYYEITPTESFSPLSSGEMRNYFFRTNDLIDKRSEVPTGIFSVVDEKVFPMTDFVMRGLDETVLAKANPTTAKTRYFENQRLSLLPEELLLPFVPSPAEYRQEEGHYEINLPLKIFAAADIQESISIFQERLSELGLEAVISSEENCNLRIQIDDSIHNSPEAYTLTVGSSNVVLTGAHEKGVFYGLQSLVQVLSNGFEKENQSTIKVNKMSVLDYPRFAYRGMHLDVSRNFHSMDNVKRIIDQMAFYKLNVFHFHLTDDEGWRLEIPGLPELTDIGSKRGYTEDESDRLRPSFGSGGKWSESYGSGHYSREEFIAFLKYANDRQIDVIPEIDFPSHSRAAIISMRERYRRLLSEGSEEEALKYYLEDPNDQSEYRSAQNWDDNVICVCREGAYNFFRKVVEEIVAMYEEADIELDVFHVGGDEMPYGAWFKSPICQAFVSESSEIESMNEIPAYFFGRAREILEEYNLTMAGWEEMTIKHSEDAHEGTDINLDFLEGSPLNVYVWNAIAGGGRDDMVYRLANAGYPVVMCNSSSFYFDMAYDRDPDETGLSWSGFANTEKAFSTEPLNLFHGFPRDAQGNLLSQAYLDKVDALSNQGALNFIGIQCQLWSETVTRPEFLDYLIFPKLLGFAERAWAKAGAWTMETNKEEIDATYQSEWNVLANTIGQRSMPMMDRLFGGVGYRIPEPGAIIQEGKVIMNTAFPGLEIKNEENMAWSQSSTGREGRRATVK